MTKSFDHNDRAAIEAAIASPDPENEIAGAIAVRIDAMTKIIAEAVEKQGELPRQITVTKPASALDEVVIALFQEALQEQYVLLAKSLGKDISELSLPEIVVLDHGRQ
jgi:hypothetical protein